MRSQVKSKFREHVWDTYMFPFYKYAALVSPSLDHVAYIKDPPSESDWWLSSACLYCRRLSEFLYRYHTECVRPALSECHSRYVSGGLRPWREPLPTWRFATS